MGQKVHPTGFRVGITEDWRSRWFASKSAFSRYLVEDEKIRRFIKQNFKFAAIPLVEIERTTADQVTVILHTARPGIVIGRKGAEVDRMKGQLEDLIHKSVNINIREVTRPELSGQLVAEAICGQLEKRTSFRRAMKRAMETTMGAGAGGMKVQVSGRLGGAEMARSESLNQGKVPLHTLRAKIDYGFSEAATQYGKIGVKVHIYLGEHEKEVPRGASAQEGQTQKSPAGQSPGHGQPV